MALNFPSAPSLNQTYTANGRSWIFNGDSWDLQSALVTNASISADAEIAVSKLADGAARQLLQTDAAGTGVEWTSNVDIPGTLDVTGAATLDSTLSFPLGSAGSPSLYPGTDTNTGIWSPAADTLAWSTGGSERVRIDSSGNVTINGPANFVAPLINSASGTNPSTNIPYTPLGGGYSLVNFDSITGGANATFLRLGGVSAGNNSSASWVGAIYNLNFSSNLRLYSGKQGNNTLAPYDSALSAEFSQEFVSFFTGNIGTENTTERMRIASNGQLSAVVPGGTTLYPGYMCRAWVNFNPAANTIAASGNVSSLTDQGVGTTDVNLTTAMPDTNYAVSAGVGDGFSAANQQFTVTWGFILSSSKIQVNSRLVDNDGNTMAGTDQNPTFCVVFR